MTASSQSDHADPAQTSATDPQAQLVTNPPEMPSWHLTIAYNGTRYHGWQKQPNALTIQGEIESRLQRLFRDPELKIAGTSRTDAGVHAVDQHATFQAPATSDMTPARLQTQLNRWLPDDIRIPAVEVREPDFHARFSAKGKAYTYIVNTADHCTPFEFPFVWHVPQPLQIENMKRAGQEMAGKKDFATFSVNPRRELESTVKKLHRVDVITTGNYIVFDVVGDGFLYKMVRSIVGYLILIAGQKPDWQPAELQVALAAAKRTSEIKTAPPQGLFLAKVFFGEAEWRSYNPRLKLPFQ
jgi:tRNA pseudouridine38-40 synthase